MTKGGVFGLAAIIAIGAWIFWPSSPHFVKEDVEKIKSDIRAEFGKRDGIKVVDVQMIKESDRKLSGFVKLEIEALAELKNLGGVFDGTILKECSASMADNWETIWSCK
jgi:hypothetical protein